MKFKKQLSLLLLFLSLNVFSQKAFQYWSDFNSSTFVSKRTSILLGFGYRTSTNGARWNQWIGRSSVQYSINSNWKLNGEFAYFERAFENANKEKELRISQGVVYQTSVLNWLDIKNYFRIEERFEASSVSKFALRLRNQVQFIFSLLHTKNHQLYCPLAVEFFTNISDPSKEVVFWETYRMHTGLGLLNIERWKVELQGIVQRLRLDFFEVSNQDIEYMLRIRLHLYLKKSSSFTEKP